MLQHLVPILKNLSGVLTRPVRQYCPYDAPKEPLIRVATLIHLGVRHELSQPLTAFDFIPTILDCQLFVLFFNCPAFYLVVLETELIIGQDLLKKAERAMLLLWEKTFFLTKRYVKVKCLNTYSGESCNRADRICT